MIFICILPLSLEFVYYLMKLKNISYSCLKEIRSFLAFAITTSIIGIIYTITGRLYLLKVKELSDSIAALISYSSGMIGIITILNTTFSSYFIGKLDARDISGIAAYLKKIKRAIPWAILFISGISVFLFLFVYFVYPYEKFDAALYTIVSFSISCAIAFLGLITLLTKTFDLLKLHLFINICSFLSVYILINTIEDIENFYVFLAVSAIPVIFEFLLALIVKKICFIKIGHGRV